MEDAQRPGTTRYRVYQILGIVIGLLFLGLGAAAFFAGGGGPIVAAIATAGGILVLIVSIVSMVRS